MLWIPLTNDGKINYWGIMLCINLLLTGGYLLCQALMYFDMNKYLKLLEEYENNPGLDIQKLKTQLELMINKSLLVTELILFIIAFHRLEL